MRFALRRLGFFVLTLWVALTINFLLPRLMPGNPALAMLRKFHGQVGPAALKALEILFGINTEQSLLAEQYVTYLHHVVTGNFGTSLDFYPAIGRLGHRQRDLVDARPGRRGHAAGLRAGHRPRHPGRLAPRRRGWTASLPPVFVITSAIPYFWMAMVLVLIFGITLHWLPYIGGYNVSPTPRRCTPAFICDVLRHAILPAAALLITTIGTWILTMRNTMITTLAEDYVRMARAKGLPGRRIMLDYAARNAILPNLTGFAMSLGFVVSGAILIEYVFNYPGVGYMLLQAVQSEDYPLMQALFLLITVAVLVAILIADIATALLDPRTRTAG